jgi:hypothetical protein
MLETGPDNRRIAKTSKLRVKLKPGVYKLEASVSTATWRRRQGESNAETQPFHGETRAPPGSHGKILSPSLSIPSTFPTIRILWRVACNFVSGCLCLSR